MTSKDSPMRGISVVPSAFPKVSEKLENSLKLLAELQTQAKFSPITNLRCVHIMRVCIKLSCNTTRLHLLFVLVLSDFSYELQKNELIWSPPSTACEL